MVDNHYEHGEDVGEVDAEVPIQKAGHQSI